MKRVFALVAGLVLAASMGIGVAGPAAADNVSIDFETFTLGNPNGQQGWVFTGPYDVAVANTSLFGSPSGFGAKALRISNATTSGSFGDWAFSAPLAEAAGESGADSDGLTSAVTERRFVATFDLASAVPNALQTGLQFSVAPDRGDGARMSFLQFNDTASGIQVTFADYIDAHPQGTTLGDATGCGVEDNFQTEVIASGLDRTVPHSVSIAMEFLNGPANDRVFVSIDGVLVHVGTSWEDYYRYCEGNPTRPVDSLIFQARTSGGTAAGTLGNGFLVDNIHLKSGSIPVDGATGTWSQYPVAGQPEYKAKIRPPLKGGDSHWSSKSQGGIPVKFWLKSASSGGVFESIGSDTDTANDFAYASFDPSSNLIFGDIQTLMTDYAFTLGNCHGGSLRWEVGTAAGNLFIYYGDLPNFTDCTTNSQSETNMAGLSDARYDTSQFVGGTFYDTYAHALSVLDTAPVTYVALILDSGWGGDQRADVSDITVNDEVYQWVGQDGEFVRTCDLPPATIEVGRGDPVDAAQIAELPVQPPLEGDNNAFQIIDCKYRYVLSIPSLTAGTGLYHVEIHIGGQTEGKAQFTLR